MIIGFNGYARSGKDSAARVLIEDYGFKRIEFADKIRAVLWDLNPLIDEGFPLQEAVEMYGWDDAKVAFPEIRRLLQELGVSARDCLHQDVWVNAALKDIVKDEDYVVTDVRFVNEVAALRSLNAKFALIHRPGVTAVNSHISEYALKDFTPDYVIDNSGSLEALNLKVKDFLKEIQYAK